MNDDTTTPDVPADDAEPQVEQPTPEQAAYVEMPDESPEAVARREFAGKAMRLFGPDWMQIENGCQQTGIDFEGYVNDLIVKLDAAEMEQKDLIDTACAVLPNEIRPAVLHAIGVNHQIENVRRGLLMLLNTGALQGQLAQVVTGQFGSVTDAAGSFVNATLTTLIGRTVLGYDEATVERVIVEPFNNVMAAKRAIFDMIGDANMKLTEQIMAGMQKIATDALAPTDLAAASDGPAPDAPPSTPLH